VVAVNLVVIAIAAVASIQQGLPYEFGGHGDPHRVREDFFFGSGTAAAPPFAVAVVLAMAGLLGSWSRRIGTAGAVVTALSAVIGLISFFGEPHTWRVLQNFDPFWAAMDLVIVASLLALLAVSVLQILYRSRHGWRL
jgi:hypothetical protein